MFRVYFFGFSPFHPSHDAFEPLFAWWFGLSWVDPLGASAHRVSLWMGEGMDFDGLRNPKTSRHPLAYPRSGLLAESSAMRFPAPCSAPANCTTLTPGISDISHRPSVNAADRFRL